VYLLLRAKRRDARPALLYDLAVFVDLLDAAKHSQALHALKPAET